MNHWKSKNVLPKSNKSPSCVDNITGIFGTDSLPITVTHATDWDSGGNT